MWKLGTAGAGTWGGILGTGRREVLNQEWGRR